MERIGGICKRRAVSRSLGRVLSILSGKPRFPLSVGEYTSNDPRYRSPAAPPAMDAGSTVADEKGE